jgi:glutamine amidotransferase
MITIIDYGMGNLRSVQKGFARVGAEAVITANPADIARAERLVLPGVGAFRDAIACLRSQGFVEPILGHIQSGKPFLGICLGLQLLFERSFEDGEYAGLGVVAGDVVRLPAADGLKIPHMGWNQLRIRRPSPLLRGIESGSYVYFVHSYHVVPHDPSLVAAETDYAAPFVSIVWRDNIVATQFHPEKSQQVGLAMLRNFATL